MDYLISSILGYLLGSFPTAYIILSKRGIDVTKTGSGNVGAMNSFEITKSKSLGILVFFIDFLKGLIPIFIITQFYPSNFTLAGISLLFAIFSHCFNPWINFNGGRGLATASGGILFLFFPLLLCWISIWILAFVIKKDILLANISSTVLSLILSLIFADYFIKFAYPSTLNENELLLFISSGLILIFIKHIEPLKEILTNRSK